LWKDNIGNTVLNETSNLRNNTINNLSSGSYSIVVEDANGCSTNEVYNLADPGQLLVEIEQKQDILCYGVMQKA